MSRITNIINNARDELGDTNTSALRYTDDKLISYLNEGIKSFVKTTKYLKERLYLSLNQQSAIYDIGNYSYEVVRVEYNGEPVATYSMEEMDSIYPYWQSETGTEVKAIVFDKHRKGKFRVYPRVEGSADIVTQNSPYGGLIDITIGDDDYQIPTLEDIDTDIDKYLVLYIIKKPKVVTINTLDSELEISDEYDLAMVHYIKSRCLKTDTDINNRQFASEELQEFIGYTRSTRVSEAKSNNATHDRVTKYNGGFN